MTPLISIHTFKEFLELVMIQSIGLHEIHSLDDNLHHIFKAFTWIFSMSNPMIFQTWVVRGNSTICYFISSSFFFSQTNHQCLYQIWWQRLKKIISMLISFLNTNWEILSFNGMKETTSSVTSDSLRISNKNGKLSHNCSSTSIYHQSIKFEIRSFTIITDVPIYSISWL